MPRQPSSPGPKGRAAGSSSSRSTGRPAPQEGGPHSDRRSSGGRPSSSGSRPYRERSGESRGAGERGNADRPRRDADDRRPRRDDDGRGPRRDFDERRSSGGRPSTSGSRPYRERSGESRGAGERGNADRPRRDFDDRRSSGGRPSTSGSRPYRERSGESRGAGERGNADRPRRDFDDRRPRRDADDRGPRRDFDDRRPRRDADDRRPRRDADDRGPRRDSGSRSGDRRMARPEPRTEAERRRAAVRARGGGTARQEDGRIRDSAPPERVAEQWIDEGPVNRRASATDGRGVAQRAVKRAVKSDEAALDPATRLDVERSVPAKRQVVLSDRLKSAQNSLERERFSEAKRIARSLVKEMGGVAAVHEVIGLASYRLGQWRDATNALELARSIRPRVEDLPVLADCYRAQHRWQDVDDVWSELKMYSPAQEILSEGRIVYAGSLADRGDLYGAIAVMMRSLSAPRRVRDHHLRQWYVLADLYDRAGNVQKARELFKRVASINPDFSDVGSRIAQL